MKTDLDKILDYIHNHSYQRMVNIDGLGRYIDELKDPLIYVGLKDLRNLIDRYDDLLKQGGLGVVFNSCIGRLRDTVMKKEKELANS